MRLILTALGLKTLLGWGVLALFGLVGGPTPTQALVMAVAVAVISWAADVLLPFKLQGFTRFLLDGILAVAAIYTTQGIWPGRPVTFTTALIAGMALGALELPLHFYLASRFSRKQIR